MARERSPERDKAKLLWLQSGGTMKLKDIAAALSVGETQVRKWKSQDKWAADLNSNVTIETKGNVTKRGAPKGNKNAVGNRGGAPPGNQNAAGNRGGAGGPPRNTKAVKTGEYQTLWMDALSEDEQEQLERVVLDPAGAADDSIILLSWREKEMVLKIQALKNGLSEKQRRVLHELKGIKEAMTVHDEKTGVTKTVPFTRNELVISQIEETEFRAIDDIIKIEEALTRVQAQKLKAIKLKYELSSPEQQARVDKLRGEARRLGVNDIKEPLHIVVDYGDDDAPEDDSS